MTGGSDRHPRACPHWADRPFFIGLAEGYVLAAFRQVGVPLQRIRPAIEQLRREFDNDHVMASKSLYTDGAEVLYDYAESSGDTPEAKSARDLVVVRNGQLVFQDIVDQYLRRIDFGLQTAGLVRFTCPSTARLMS